MATPVYPLTDEFKERLAEGGIDPTSEPYNQMLYAIEAYEHGNACPNSVHTALNMAMYVEVAVDLAYAINFGRA